MSFVHLHNHTHYSLLDGLARPIDLINKAKEQNSPAIAITDHGVMYGAIEFYKLAKKNDINPIIGCEAYIHPVSRFNRDKNSRYNHLLLLAYNTKGYENLLRLTTIAHLEGFYYKPRIDFEILKEYSEGLIGSSACLKGQIAEAFLAGKEEKAYEILKKYQEVFGKENFFLELQHHPHIKEQQQVNEKIIELAKASGAPLIITNDAHYINSDDCQAHDVLICIQTGKNIDNDDRLKYTCDFSLKSPKEIARAFPDQQEAMKNTVEIARKCRVEIKLGLNLIPSFQTPFNKEPYEYLRELCNEGIKERYGEKPPQEALERLEYELELIHKMGFDTYFLIVHDFIDFAKRKKIVVGPGRGSAAGSMVSYCLKITDLDPLKYGLLFERFLNPERISMPDIDIDFADTRRDEVLDYVSQKYGKDHVAQIITFGTMAAKAAVRDAGRALGYPYAEVDQIAKLVPNPILGKHAPLQKSVEENAELSEHYQNNPRAKKLLDTAIKLEGTIRHAGTHACAVIISKEPLVNYCPIQKAPGEDQSQITQYSMKPLEDIGLLKMDFLGLRNLTIIETALKILQRTKQLDIDITKIPIDDRKTFELLSKGETTGVFQLESAGMKRYLKELKPTCFEDIIAMVSLYRPGPMEWIPDYIKRKHGEKKIEYLHPSLEEILKETYGIAIYQEQILQIAQEFAGFSLGEADLLRRAIGKKIPKELAAQRKKFIDGAVQAGKKEKLAIDMFEKIVEPFAGYGFNKSHAACYALISYQTAYLKANFPAEFMTALLSADAENTDRIVIEINECERMGIKVLPPSINESLSSFTVIDDQHIRFGLHGIKGIGASSTEEIFSEREKNGKFESLKDFVKRIPTKIINKKNLESLIFSGALDELEERAVISKNLEEIMKFARSCQEKGNDGQIAIFDLMTGNSEDHEELVLRAAEPTGYLERLTQEKKYLGLFVSGHPLDGLRQYFMKKAKLISKLAKSNTGKICKIAGLITEVKRVTTRTGYPMLYGKIEDPSGSLRFTVFPKIYQSYKDTFQEDQLIVMNGRIEYRNDEFQMLCQEAKSISLENIIAKAKNEGIFNPEDKVIKVANHSEQANGVTNGMLSIENNEAEGGESSEQFLLQEKNNKDPFVITLHYLTPAEKLQKLNEILKAHPGARSVEIHIVQPDNVKKIRLPFNVQVDNNLKNKISDLLENKISA